MSSQGRRKHNACLFRMRENCPFRKLKRNVCSDCRSTLVPTGGHWRTVPPQAGPSVSNCGINRVVEVKTFSRPPQSACHLHEEFSAMDTDMAPPTGSSYSVISDNLGPSNISLINQQRHMSSNNMIMDLDSKVDPETGERAQG
ncbi:uncharacterized protein LOC143723248 [Siphateles boraxobius]|uniref:uncharacterized protein LOC143723248 n=1 Tax=Siphateles boraxobius TaxID=180520 RepID=UPI0040637787